MSSQSLLFSQQMAIWRVCCKRSTGGMHTLQKFDSRNYGMIEITVAGSDRVHLSLAHACHTERSCVLRGEHADRTPS